MRQPTPLRRQLRLVTLAWVFGAVWLYLTTGAALTRYAQLLDMPPLGFGLLAALPFAGALFQLPASYFVERYGHRKTFFIAAGILHRALWIVVAILPWVLPARACWPAMIAVVALSWIAGQAIGPCWVSWMADLVPGPIRGRYFARRSQIGQFVGLLVTLAIGYILDQATQQGEVTLLRTLAAVLALAAAAGVSDFLFFLPVPDRPSRQPNPHAQLGAMLRAPWRDPNFRRFAGWTATLTFASGFVPQFTWLYVLDVVGWSNTRANAMLVLMPLLLVMLFSPLWGRAVDRFGRKPILLLAGLAVLPGRVAWLLVSHDEWIVGYALVVVSTAAWPGIEIANFNMLLRMNARQDSSAHVAVNSALGAVAGILSGLFGGAVAAALGNWQATVWGWPVTYHGVLFVISTLLQLAAWWWLLGLKDTGTGDTRMALRYLGTNLYSNVQQAVFLPGRLLQQLSRWTFPLRSGRRPRGGGVWRGRHDAV